MHVDLRASGTPDLRSGTVFFNDTATTEIYTLSLHDALPIFFVSNTSSETECPSKEKVIGLLLEDMSNLDRKSTRLNSSHANISYAVFCLKKKEDKHIPVTRQTGRQLARRLEPGLSLPAPPHH